MIPLHWNFSSFAWNYNTPTTFTNDVPNQYQTNICIYQCANDYNYEHPSLLPTGSSYPDFSNYFSCDCSSYRITSLRYTDINITCPTNFDLPLPYYLQSAYMSYNQLNVNFTSFTKLPILNNIYLSHSNIIGELPSDVSVLAPVLSTLDLSSEIPFFFFMIIL